MRLRRAAAALALALTGACDTPCAYRIVDRMDSGVRAIACCGAIDAQEIALPDAHDLAMAIYQQPVAGGTAGQDLWVTGPDCNRLFDEPYSAPGKGPRPVPRCPVFIGPVSPGRTSPRASMAPGRYKVFAMAYTTNATAASYRYDLNLWASDCGGSPVRP